MSREFTLTLSRRVNEPTNAGNPWIMNFDGHIESEDDESSYTMNVLLLKRGNFVFIAIASEDNEQHTVKAKAMISGKYFSENRDDFHSGCRWKAVYLGSLVTHERMFDACKNYSERLNYTSKSIVQKICSGSIGAIVSGPMVAGLNSLNQRQKSVVQDFLSLPHGNVMLLQGPPGTGKTTTISILLRKLCESNTRTLMCAPSNKAVQVIALRFLKDNPHVPIILSGVESKLIPELEGIFMNKIVKKVLHNVRKFDKLKADTFNREICKSFDDQVKCVEKMNACFVELYNCIKIYNIISKTLYDIYVGIFESFKKSPQENFNRVIQEIDSIMVRLKATSAEQTLEDKINILLLNNSKVVFSTLSSSGNRTMMTLLNSVDNLVIDEAAQCVEAETLIALQHNPRKVLLVGDIKQLPATVTSVDATAHHYDWSMMFRLQAICNQPAKLLTEQYRMHPDICAFPSLQYYSNELQSAPSILQRSDVSSHFDDCHYLFFDIKAQQNGKCAEKKQGNSRMNPFEANYVAKIVQKIRQTDITSTIGVITFYSAQRELIDSEITKLKSTFPNIKNRLQISSVDGFQGDECDIIIVSCVRANEGNDVGFVKDERRLNVAITRAKNYLIVLGSAEVLRKGSLETKALVENAQSRSRVMRDEIYLRSVLGMPADNQTNNTKGKSGKRTESSNVVVDKSVENKNRSRKNSSRKSRKEKTTNADEIGVSRDAEAAVVSNKTSSNSKKNKQVKNHTPVQAVDTHHSNSNNHTSNKVAAAATVRVSK